MTTKEGSTKIVTFMTLGSGVLVQGVAICPVKIFFSTPRHRHTKYIVMLTKEGSTKIVNFMTPRAGGLMLGIIVNMYYLLLYQYTAH